MPAIPMTHTRSRHRSTELLSAGRHGPGLWTARAISRASQVHPHSTLITFHPCGSQFQSSCTILPLPRTGPSSPHERPHFARGGVGNAAPMQIFEEADLIDSHEGTKPHGHRGELPELRHEPGCG
jgi:hypothetical protein